MVKAESETIVNFDSSIIVSRKSSRILCLLLRQGVKGTARQSVRKQELPPMLYGDYIVMNNSSFTTAL